MRKALKFAMAELSLNDIETMYVGSIVMYQNKPVLFKAIAGDLKVTAVDLASGKKEYVPFDRKMFKPHLGRIGYINQGGHAFYTMRMPSRRFSIGITRTNTRMAYVEKHKFDDSFLRAIDKVHNLQANGWASCFANKYPKLADAIKIAAASQGSCAFDKQFAVDRDRVIYYKGKAVGNIDARCSTLKRITFKEGFEFLQILLEPNYEKTARTFSS